MKMKMKKKHIDLKYFSFPNLLLQLTKEQREPPHPRPVPLKNLDPIHTSGINHPPRLTTKTEKNNNENNLHVES